ncbi:MAG: ParB N-terminal domain-containing protein [Pseudomonadota bacterium]
MAKRRRLITSPTLENTENVSGQEMQSRFSSGTGHEIAPPPIAKIAEHTAKHAAMEEMSRSIEAARAEGRLAEPLPLDKIVDTHLVRDRVMLDENEMQILQASLAARGQQTPIEVEPLADGRFGLITGWRRVTALRRNGAATVLSIIRKPDTVVDAYRSMVEENEIRSGLTYWERAHIARRGSEMGVFDSTPEAIAGLFPHASKAKRSKIGSFAALIPLLEPHIRFPNAIPERLGLALAGAMADPEFAAKLREALREAAPESAEAERAVLDRVMKRASGASPSKPDRRRVTDGIDMEIRKGRITLSGSGVTPDVAEDLQNWLGQRSRTS